jgi:hypothetical protein
MEDVTKWAAGRNLKLTEIDSLDDRGGKRPAIAAGIKRDREGAERPRSRSSSISSADADGRPVPSWPKMPTVQAAGLPLSVVTDRALDANKMPTSASVARSREQLMAIDLNPVQTLQTKMADLHDHKTTANQTVAASIHAPANQMAISPVSPTPAPGMPAARIVTDTRPPILKAPQPSITELAILDRLSAIQATIERLSGRVGNLEKSKDPRKRPTPSTAPPVLAMPPRPQLPVRQPLPSSTSKRRARRLSLATPPARTR